MGLLLDFFWAPISGYPLVFRHKSNALNLHRDNASIRGAKVAEKNKNLTYLFVCWKTKTHGL